ncbi:carboxymuconolactone decarboxylase family protein [Aestuariispira insulae]|uniref:Alkyl hydroperoxide reductase AhpD n=1 Tax=Aestuariispira insulae TaxID=1461337 RepID=A0A3D9HK04_9PROT|nr:carboxymuconolactone decarboxylase family protein [Aestuariispira insulae]RED49755.1 alkyl hydroperoxide reductase subunit D [Aestuariispira insulae]
MSLDSLKALLPDYAKDIKLNLGAISRETALSEQQLYGTLLASALASRNAAVIKAAAAEADPHLSDEAKAAAKAAAAVMGMNNIYYRFIHLVSDKTYQTLPAKLRMNVIANPGVDKVDFELWSLAVSAVNGCGLCIDSHEQVLRKAGLGADAVQAAARIAAIIHAVAAILDGEDALNAA